MAGIDNFTLSWWYSPNTKLAINLTTVGASLTNISGLNYRTGVSASVDELYHLENTITDYPVEGSLSISDHIINRPNVFTITGLLTAISTIPIVGLSRLDFKQLGDGVDFLFRAAKKRELFTLSTGLYFGKDYFSQNNLAIESIDIPRNNQFGRSSIKFTIRFKQIRITDSNADFNTKSSTAVAAPNAPGAN